MCIFILIWGACNMTTELVPSVKAALEIIPEQKKDKFDRAMEVAHLFMDGTVGTVCGCIRLPQW